MNPRIFTATRESGEQVLVTLWPDATAEVAFRPGSWLTWGPPTALVEEASAGVVSTERAAGMLEVIEVVQSVFDLQCPPMPVANYVDSGAHAAHTWWNTVLGRLLRDLRERAAKETAPSQVARVGGRGL